MTGMSSITLLGAAERNIRPDNTRMAAEVAALAAKAFFAKPWHRRTGQFRLAAYGSIEDRYTMVVVVIPGAEIGFVYGRKRKSYRDAVCLVVPDLETLESTPGLCTAATGVAASYFTVRPLFADGRR
jgi:hypothetical protein